MRLIAVITLFLINLSGPAWAEARIALVIGNSGYTAVEPLDNAGNDAELMAQSLEQVGFDVTLVRNASQVDLKLSVAAFGRDLRAAGKDAVGLFYYAGHGVQSFGANYLLPVDASLTVAADLDLVGLEAASVLRQMASARNRTNIVILDACRNNPFTDIPDFNDNGLAEMKAPTGTYLSYATAPGAVALDGVGRNSPFTQALAEALQTEGMPIEKAFKQVRVKVIEQTGGAQTPWDTSSLTREFSFRPGRVLTAEEVAESQLWNVVKKSADPVQFMLFLRSYPEGLFAGEARDLLSKVLADELGTTLPETAAEAVAEAPPAAPAPDRESTLMEQARNSGALEDYQAYLDAFPAGIFAELVKIEIAAIKAKATEDPDAPAPADEQVAALAAEPEPTGLAEPQREVFFDQPLEYGIPQILGKTIMEVTKTTPMFPPIEGLPEPVWKDQTCSNCHLWTRDALCDQAKQYVKETAARALAKEHPLGGTFKSNLKVWAQGGCR